MVSSQGGGRTPFSPTPVFRDFASSHIEARICRDNLSHFLGPEQIAPIFNDVFRELQRGKGLEPFVFFEGHYLLSIDGTGYFSSKNIHCESCQQKVNQHTGEITYYHQMLGAVLVHPDRKEVIPLAPEPIIKQDGAEKNDCERNAAKRLLARVRQEHPHLPLIVVEDALASNAPHIRELMRHGMRFILGVKPGDHQFLFRQFIDAFEDDRVTTFSWESAGNTCEIAYLNGVPLNDSNRDIVVNVLQYCEYHPDGTQCKHFTWITDITITKRNARTLVKGGRSRWKVENETFNTLKNQGYHFEHNFGHGTMNLSTVFAMLMMLAFLVDQVQQICCSLFQAVLIKVRTKRALWDKIRSHYRHFVFESMQHLYQVMLHDLGKVPAPKVVARDTS
jgi:hypothetical protein